MGHVIPKRVYFTVYVLLVLLLGLTYGVAHLDFGPMNLVFALGIAIVKAVLVILYFMGVKYGSRLTWLWASIGFLWFLIMFTILTDYLTRGWIPVGSFPH